VSTYSVLNHKLGSTQYSQCIVHVCCRDLGAPRENLLLSYKLEEL